MSTPIARVRSLASIHRKFTRFRRLTTRNAFTLVELLVVIAIISILLALALGAYRGAQRDTMAAKTRGTISKIESILNERFDEYLSKPLKFDATGAAFVADFPVENRVSPNSPNKIGKLAAASGVASSLLRERVRIAAIRDLMRMEMPDCVGDLFTSSFRINPSMAAMLSHANPPVPLVSGYGLGPARTPLLMRLEPPSDFMRILQRVHQADLKLQAVNRLRGGRVASAIDPTNGTVTSIVGTQSRWADEYPNEELLYMIVESTFTGGSPAIEAFGASEISDKDEDGLLEFVDAWGTPIRWLRWPTGILSIAPTNPDPLNVYNPVGTDAFDPTQADVGYDPANDTGNSIANLAYPGFFPRPLVISAGPDGRFGLRFYPVDPATQVVSPTFSPARVQLPILPNFRSPAYWPTGFNWPDPFCPRALMNVNSVDILRYRPGAILTNPSVPTDPHIDDYALDPIGVDLESNTVHFVANPQMDDGRFSLHASDNVSNLDESGASL